MLPRQLGGDLGHERTLQVELDASDRHDRPLETVLDYMLQTEVVVKALEHFRERHWNEIRTLDELERLIL